MASSPYAIGLARNAANFQPADAADLPRAGGRGLSRRTRPSCMASLHAQLCRILRARAPARLGARRARGRPERHRLGDARQHARHARMPLRRADARRRAERAQHAARCGAPRLHARSRRDEGADRRSRILAGDARGLAPREGRSRWSSTTTTPNTTGEGERARQARLRGLRRVRRPGFRLVARRTTNGTRSRSTTPPARPAIRRASSTIIAARRCSPRATSSPAAWESTRSICGPCRCSIAMAGASPGRSRSSPARMSACGRCGRSRSSS